MGSFGVLWVRGKGDVGKQRRKARVTEPKRSGSWVERTEDFNRHGEVGSSNKYWRSSRRTA
jgi:hypothetical protein